MLQSAQIKLDVTKAHGFCPEDIQGPEYLLLEQSPGHAQGIGVSVTGQPLCVYPILALPYCFLDCRNMQRNDTLNRKMVTVKRIPEKCLLF